MWILGLNLLGYCVICGVAAEHTYRNKRFCLAYAKEDYVEWKRESRKRMAERNEPYTRETVRG